MKMNPGGLDWDHHIYWVGFGQSVTVVLHGSICRVGFGQSVTVVMQHSICRVGFGLSVTMVMQGP